MPTRKRRGKPQAPQVLPLIMKDDDNWRKAVAFFNELKLLVCRPIRW
jgi:hypothetical protein